MRGRFAPSPTGAMHLGNARTALLAWLAVRRAGGTIVMRIEDLDAARVIPGAEAQLLEDMKWLGLDWDEAPIRQSERTALYDEAMSDLVRKGIAYECACSRAEIALASSAPHADSEGPRYPGTCRDLEAGEAAAKAAKAGRKTALRFHGEGVRVEFDDQIRGLVEPLGVAGVDDFVIRRVDGVAAYQLAVVVDDAAQGIDHVLRADDLLTSTPRQIALYKALGKPIPVFAHVPLVLAPGGERLAKRNRPKSIAELRVAGVKPETIAGALAASAGLCKEGTKAMPAELVKEWDPAKVGRDPIVVTFGV